MCVNMSKESILVNGVPFYYEKETLNYEVCEPMNHDEAKVLLRHCKKLCLMKKDWSFI